MRVAVICALLSSGCALFKPAAAPELPSYCFDEDLLRAKVFACVASSETKPESRACRVQVLHTCGIEMSQ